MDRRAALKKLAAGGAIALAGPTVLSSNMVAFAASGPASILAYTPGGNGATFTIQGFPAGSHFQWRLSALNLTSASKKQVDLIDGSGNVLYQSPLGQRSCGPCTPWTTSSNSLGTVQLTRHQGMKPGDSFELDLIVTTPNPNSQTTEYRIRGVYGSAPTVEAL